MSKDKPNAPRFYAENAAIDSSDRRPIFRDTEMRFHNSILPAFKREKIGETIVVTVSLTSSGNTTAMTSAEICAWVMSRLNK